MPETKQIILAARSPRSTHIHNPKNMFYTSRVTLMPPYRKHKSNSRDQNLSYKKAHASHILTQKVSAIGTHLNVSLNHQKSSLKIQNDQQPEHNHHLEDAGKTIHKQSKLLQQSLALLSGTDALKGESTWVGNKKKQVHKMLTDYKMVVEQSEKEKRKRNSRLHGAMKTYTQQNQLIEGEAISQRESTQRRKIIQIVSSNTACHLKSIEQKIFCPNIKNLYKVHDLKYEGKEAGGEILAQNKWRVSQLVHNTHFRKKKSYRHHSEDKNLTNLIERDESLLERLNIIQKEVSLIRSGKLEGTVALNSKNFMSFPLSMKQEKEPEIILLRRCDNEKPEEEIQEKTWRVKANSIKFKPKSKSYRTCRNPEETQIVVDPWKFEYLEDLEQETNFENLKDCTFFQNTTANY